jgi:hypothetical protein
VDYTLEMMMVEIINAANALTWPGAFAVLGIAFAGAVVIWVWFR